MPRLRLVPDDFAGTSLFEALGRALMGFQLGHFLLFFDGIGSPFKLPVDRDFPAQ